MTNRKRRKIKSVDSKKIIYFTNPGEVNKRSALGLKSKKKKKKLIQKQKQNMDNESGIDMNFDFIDFEYVFEDDKNAMSLLDKACDDVMFYELKSKTVPEETET